MSQISYAKVVTSDPSPALTPNPSVPEALSVNAAGRLRVDASGSTTTTSSAALPAGTDRSGSITTGGTAQQLAPSNANRMSLTGQNISAGDLWINEIGGTAAVAASGSYQIPAGAAFSIATNRAVSIIGATTGQKFSATETP